MAPREYLAPALAAGLLAAGCTDVRDYQVVPSWLLNSAAPDGPRCAEQGIDRVQVIAEGPRRTLFYDAPCEQNVALVTGDVVGGLRTGFDFDYGVLYDVAIETVDGAGNVLDGFDLQMLEQFPVDAVELPTADIFQPFGVSASISGVWQFSSGDCRDAGVRDVAIWGATANDLDLETLEEIAWAPCEDGGLDTVDPVLAQGEYSLFYVALGDRGEVLAESGIFDASVWDSGQHVELPAVQLNL